MDETLEASAAEKATEEPGTPVKQSDQTGGPIDFTGS